jgi:hypothetical protein
LSAQPPSASKTVADLAVVNESQRKCKCGGSINLTPYQTAAKKAKMIKDKLNAMMALLEQSPEGNDESLMNGSKSFIHHVHPIVKCFMEHYNSDVVEFEKAHPNLTHTTFKCQCSQS